MDVNDGGGDIEWRQLEVFVQTSTPGLLRLDEEEEENGMAMLKG